MTSNGGAKIHLDIDLQPASVGPRDRLTISQALPVLIIGGKNLLRTRVRGQRVILNTKPTILGDDVAYNGTLYPVKILKESAHLFEGAPVYESHWHYSTKPILGRVRRVRWSETRKGIVGLFHPVTYDIYRELLESSIDGRMPSISGNYWVDFEALQLGPERYKLVTKIHSVKAVDLVPQAGAGGAFLID